MGQEVPQPVQLEVLQAVLQVVQQEVPWVVQLVVQLEVPKAVQLEVLRAAQLVVQLGVPQAIQLPHKFLNPRLLAWAPPPSPVSSFFSPAVSPSSCKLSCHSFI